MLLTGCVATCAIERSASLRNVSATESQIAMVQSVTSSASLNSKSESDGSRFGSEEFKTNYASKSSDINETCSKSEDSKICIPADCAEAESTKSDNKMNKGYDLLLSNFDTFPHAVDDSSSPSKASCTTLFRIFILILTTLALTMTLANMLVFNFAIVSIVPSAKSQQHDSASDANCTEEEEMKKLDRLNSGGMSTATIAAASKLFACSHESLTCQWSVEQQSQALAAPGWGMAIAILPVSFLMQRIGPRWTFTLVALPSALATLACPLAVLYNYELFLCMRLIQGFGYCACSPLMVSMVTRWSARGETGRFTSIASCCFQLASIIAMPVSGMASASKHGWPMAFYAIGLASTIIVLLWALMFRDSPICHPWISRDEMVYIVRGKANSHRNTKESKYIPYKAIFTSAAVWAVAIARLGDQFVAQLILMYMPTYLRRVMNLDLRMAGFNSAAPTVAQAFVKFGVGYLSDRSLPCKACSTETAKVKIFNSIAFLGAALFYVGLSFLQSTRDATLALVLFSLAMGALGCNVGGWLKSVSLVAQVYSGFVMGIALFADCIVALSLPFIVGPLTPNQQLSEWRSVFLVVAAIAVAANFVFAVFGSGRAAEWTERKFDGNYSRSSGSGSFMPSDVLRDLKLGDNDDEAQSSSDDSI